MDNRIIISILDHMYFNKKKNLRMLDQSRITKFEEFASFDRFYEFTRTGLRYPKRQSNKFETYSWTPTLFEFSDRTFKRGRPDAFIKNGLWRTADAQANMLTAFVIDIDNPFDGRDQMTIEAVTGRLEETGIRYFLYTTYSHGPDKHKFRLVMPVSRHLTNDEAASVFSVFNWHLFCGQGDASIYDRGDHIYGPPYSGIIENHNSENGVALDVDGYLELSNQLPFAARPAKRRTQNRSRHSSTRDISATAGQLEDQQVRAYVSIFNNEIWDMRWTGDYAAKVKNGSHWETMRTLLGRVWRRTRGSLSHGEMSVIFDQIDATDGALSLSKTPSRWNTQ